MKELIRNIPDRAVCGVYALVDESGKVYIGSSIDISRRVNCHLASMRRVIKDKEITGLYNNKLSDAVLNGMTFDCVILEEITSDSIITLRSCEKKWLDSYNGTGCTYNSGEIFDYGCIKYLDNPMYAHSGIYAIKNSRNGLVLVGKTSLTVRKRIMQIFRELKRGIYSNKDMQYDFDNGDTFTVDILSHDFKDMLKYIKMIGENRLYNKNIDRISLSTENNSKL